MKKQKEGFKGGKILNGENMEKVRERKTLLLKQIVRTKNQNFSRRFDGRLDVILMCF